MKWKRLLRNLLLALVLLVGIALVAGFFLLRSPLAARKTESLLQAALGVPAQIDSVSVGLFGSSSGKGVRIYEPDGGEPWLTLGAVSADASLLDVIRDAVSARTVTVRAAQVRLRFDSAGQLVTVLPKPAGGASSSAVSAIHIEDSKVTLDQAGHPPLVLEGVSARLKQEDGVWKLEGSVEDSQWGAWSAGGGYDPKTETATLKLDGKRVALTPQRLRELPFVLPAVWDNVDADGPANVVLTLRMGGKAGFGYDAIIEPLQATVRVSSVGLVASDTTGSVEADNGLVTLRGLHGRSAGGSVTADGKLDFRPSPWKLDIRASTAKTDLKTFTSTWQLPEQIRKISGKLTGSANLLITIGDKTVISGEGKGQIDDAVLLGDIKTDGPIKLRLFYRDGKPEFKSEFSLALPRLPAAWALLYSPAQEEQQAEPPKAAPAQEGLVRTLLDAPVQAVTWLHKGITYAAHAVADGGKAVMAAMPGGPAKPPGKGPNYFEASFGLKDVDLGQLVQRLGVKVPFPVAGRGSIKVKAALPTDTPGDVAAYRIDGTIDLERIKIADLELDHVTARIHLDKGVLQLEGLRGEVKGGTKPGSLQGSARMEVSPLGNISASLTLSDIPLAQVASVVPGLTDKVAGVFNATLTWKAPAEKLRDTSTWEVRGVARADKLRVFETALDQVSTVFHADKGELAVTQIKLGVEGLNTEGSGTVTLSGAYPFRFKFGLDDIDLSAARRLTRSQELPLTVEGRLSADATISGTVTPRKVEASGSVDARKLKLGGVNLEKVNSGWKLEEDRLTLEKLNALLYRGKVSGSAVVPLRDTTAGTVNLKLEGVNVGLLAKDIKGLPVKLDGEASGSLEGKFAPAARDGERELTTRLDLNAPKLRVQGIPTEHLQGRIGYRQSEFHYNLTGDALGGKFELEGRVPAGGERKPDEAPKPRALPEQEKAPPPGTSGSFRLRGARISELVRVLARQDVPTPLRGLIELSADYTADAAGELTGSGNFEITRLRWDRTDLASSLSGRLRIRKSVLELPEFSGEFLGGSARLRASIFLNHIERSSLTLHLDRLDASKLAEIFLGNEALADGAVDVRLYATLGQELSGSGEAVLARGKVYRADITEWHLPFRFGFNPDTGTGRVVVNDSVAMLAFGRANGNVTYEWGGAGVLEGKLRLTNGELRALLRPFSDIGSQFGTGRAAVRLDFSGRAVRTLSDITARLEADLRQTQALQLPVLQAVTPFLGGVSAATGFETGDLRATLNRGVWRVSRLTAEGRTLKLMADGTVTIGGRLDMEVTARTGELIVNPLLLRAVALASGQALPLAVLVRASDWLANRVVHLHASGTLSSPVVRVERVRLLTEETVRFFINSSLPSPSSSPASGPGSR